MIYTQIKLWNINNKSRKSDANPLKKYEICVIMFDDKLYPFAGMISEVRHGSR